MLSLYSYIFLFLAYALQPEGHYKKHKQYCGDLTSFNIKWDLDIKKNKTFILQTTKRTNDYLSNPKGSFVAGTWEVKEDTLKLYHLGKSINPIVFYIESDKLVLQNNKASNQNMDLLFLDYLDKTINVN